MSEIRVLIRAIIIIAFLSSILMLLLENSRFKDRLRLISGVMILLLAMQILSPIFSCLRDLADLFPNEEQQPEEGDSSYDESVLKESARQMAVYIKQLISSRFSISDEDLNVAVSLEEHDEKVNVKNITVSLSKNYWNIRSDIAKYVSDMMGCQCTVMEY